MHSVRMLLAGLAATIVVWVAPANAQQPVKIRVSWVAPVSNWASIMLEKKDLAQHLGKSYTMEPVRYAGTPPMVTALASGELEVANLAYSTLAIAIKNAGIEDLRVIAHEFRDGAPGRYTHEYLVLADGPIKSAQDLKGKVVASNARGSAVDVAMRAMLRKNGLEDKRDYTVLETPFPTMRAMLAEKKVDMIPGVLPFSLDPELRKIARPLFKQSEAIGETEMIVWAVRKSFIDKNRAAMVDFMEDTLRIVRWFLDPANQKAAAEIASKVTKQPAERFGWVFTQKDYYRDRDMLPNLEALQKNLDMTTDLGFVKGNVDLAKHVDLSIVKEAAARIK
jgi:sulfonate transport system substrate-binding protein